MARAMPEFFFFHSSCTDRTDTSERCYLQHTFTMRLFKRYMADTSPQLVSAVSISQDAATNGSESSAPERPDERSKTDDRLEDALSAAKEDVDPQKESTDSILTRKGKNTTGIYGNKISEVSE